MSLQENIYKQKYLKYKIKYFNLLKIIGGDGKKKKNNVNNEINKIFNVVDEKNETIKTIKLQIDNLYNETIKNKCNFGTCRNIKPTIQQIKNNMNTIKSLVNEINTTNIIKPKILNSNQEYNLKINKIIIDNNDIVNNINNQITELINKQKQCNCITFF